MSRVTDIASAMGALGGSTFEVYESVDAIEKALQRALAAMPQKPDAELVADVSLYDDYFSALHELRSGMRSAKKALSSDDFEATLAARRKIQNGGRNLAGVEQAVARWSNDSIPRRWFKLYSVPNGATLYGRSRHSRHFVG